MIAYRDQRSRADPRQLLLQLRSKAGQPRRSAPTHDDSLQVLIQAGSLESAVADAVFTVSDGIAPITESLRRVSVTAAHVLWHTWHGTEPAKLWWDRLNERLGDIEAEQLPRQVEISVPEGYAYYAVYPEMYLESAKQCFTALRRFQGVCIGLRSIGSSLSAVVTAALEEMGCSVESLTLRPRGHPFDRYPRLEPRLQTELRQRAPGYFLIVDEGPGISGSSLAGTAAMLRGLGVEDSHILLFPSWETDGSQLRSAAAREHWSRHSQFTTSFEEVWLESGRLVETFPGSLTDISAGVWRQEVYPDSSRYPAVQPQHERRKFLVSVGRRAEGTTKLLSFAGLVETRAKVCRAVRLADAGFTAKPELLAHGFVLRPFVSGRPVSPGSVDRELVERAACYLAHLSREYAAEPSVSDSSLREMIATNVAEGMKDSSLEKLALELPAGPWVERPVALDGRMLPHEWIHTSSGYLKVDAMDHHDDHFFPGCQDIAWDVASAALELKLDSDGRRHLVEHYRRLSGDSTIAGRVHHYAVAYLAFRLGYATLAASVLGNAPDGRRFSRETRRYAGLLHDELAGAREGRWNG